jgi:hypothetical protein
VKNDVGSMKGEFAQGTGSLSSTAAARIRTAYLASTNAANGEMSSLWSMISDKSQDLRQALQTGENFISLLDNPGSNSLFYGFDNLFKEFTDQIKASDEMQTGLTGVFYRELVTLAEAVGARRARNPEFSPEQNPPPADVEELLLALDIHLGITVDFPNPFPNEYGLATSRGLASQRAIHALYQAWRLKTLSAIYGGKVLEIGAGLGRTAYYARKMGIASYTIVDIPQTNISQADFLLRVLGESNVSLSGEPSDGTYARIVPPSWLESNSEKFDIVMNVDSLTEMALETAVSYAQIAMERSVLFVSINHESNDFTVGSLEPLLGHFIGRFPYAIRPGWMEELFLNDTRLADVHASTSWRVTASLRWLKKKFSG